MAFDKKTYWGNRNSGKRGQSSELTKLEVEQASIPDGATVSFDNEGNMVVKNRAFRRVREKLYPKTSQLRKKNKRK